MNEQYWAQLFGSSSMPRVTNVVSIFYQFSWVDYHKMASLTHPVIVSVWWLSGPKDINWPSSSLLHVASPALLVQIELHRVVSDQIQGKPSAQALL